MINVSIQMMSVLVELVSILPVGTNQAVLHLLWVMVSGQLLVSRGAIYPGLNQLGLSRQQIQRAGQALRSSGWSVGELLIRWEKMVLRAGKWKVRYHGGYLGLDNNSISNFSLRLLVSALFAYLQENPLSEN